MSDILNEVEFTEHFKQRLLPFNIPLASPEPLIIELHYGEDEPVLSIPLKNIYEQYCQQSITLEKLIEPYATEISWTIQQPHYSARQILNQTVAIMRDTTLDPIAQHGKSTILEGKEIVLQLPKGPLLFQELVTRPDERLVVQFVLEQDNEHIELHRGDVLNCFPEPGQIATIASQNLSKKALESGINTTLFKIENFETTPWLIGFRSSGLEEYVASLITVSDVMLALERNLDAKEGMVAIIPSRDQLLVSTQTDEKAICEMWLLAKHLKSESRRPASGLIWSLQDGVITSIQTVNLEEEK